MDVGSIAIKAAKQRLAIANRWKTAASDQLKLAESEVKDAELCLKDTYKVWEVIDVDEEDNDVRSGDSGDSDEGKRKASVPPDHESGKKVRGDNVAVSSPPSVAAASNAPTGDGSVVEQIVVEGSGVPEVNGTYKRWSHDRLPMGIDKRCTVFSKGGLWKAEAVNFFIFRDIRSPCWYVSCRKEPKNNLNSETMFYYKSSKNDKLPPKSDWNTCGAGRNDPPYLKW